MAAEALTDRKGLGGSDHLENRFCIEAAVRSAQQAFRARLHRAPTENRQTEWADQHSFCVLSRQDSVNAKK